MTRYINRRRKKHGMPPGSLVFLGDERTHRAGLTLIGYDGDHFQEREVSRDDVQAQCDTPSVSWINVDGVHDVDLVQQLGDHFGLHPLVLEDIVSLGQRPKVEAHEGYLFFVVKMHRFDETEQRVHSEQVSIILGPTWVLSFQEEPGDVFDPVRQRLRESSGRIRKRGADYLAYALLDVIVDHYFLVLEGLSEVIENVEDHVLDDPDQQMQRRINELRRELILLRRSAWPLRELLSVLERTESSLLSADTRPYIRDVYDHAVQVLDIVESLRDVISGVMDLYMSSLSNRMNEIMKFLTIIGTIFIPLTFIAGIYGMNFDIMPELHWRYAYPATWAVMILVAATLVWYFKRRRWL